MSFSQTIPAPYAARVLIVEDEPVIAADIEAILVSAGHTVVAIEATERAAVRAFDHYMPDLVLIDIQLADGSSGIDAWRRMAAIRPFSSIFLTAFPERLLIDNRPEPTFLITKPFQPETVAAAVAQVLIRADEAAEGQFNPKTPAQVSARSLVTSAVQTTTAKKELQEKVEAGIAALASLALPPEPEPGVGHNNPPRESPLTRPEYEALMGALQDVLALATVTAPSAEALEASSELLAKPVPMIVDWTAARLSEVQKGFFTKVGENIADAKQWLAAWLLFSGTLDQVIAATAAFIASLAVG